MTEQDQIIYNTLELNLIGAGSHAGNRITRAELSYWTGWPDRTLRKHIARARRLGLRIISSNDKPGYWLGTADEWNAFCDRERRRAMANLYPKTHEIDGQLEIVFTEKLPFEPDYGTDCGKCGGNNTHYEEWEDGKIYVFCFDCKRDNWEEVMNETN